jgi:2-methylfumaryl-CoA isomerase
MVHEDPRCSLANPMFGEIEQPGVGRIMAPTAPLAFGTDTSPRPARAPRLGEHTEAVLTELLGLSSAQYGKLHDAGVVATDR